MKQVFIDTNIILDIITQREPFAAGSAAVWNLMEHGSLDGHASVISFNNVFYIARKTLGLKEARKALRIMRDTVHAVPLDEKTLDKAIDAEFEDFEDAIQFFSAIKCGADALVTRNAKDFPKNAMPILDPEEFLALNDKPI